ncbi:MAG TPA: hypothetical protein VJ944_05955 [Thermoplasmataceae archaeon]|nr:hypothetical protein [Thermoplasmataceae archaeon]
MTGKMLVLITSGLENRDKLLVGMRFAMNSARKNNLEDVKVVFFGPSEKAIAGDDQEVRDLYSKLVEHNVTSIACNGYGAANDLSEGIAKLGVKLENVSDTIPGFINSGYSVVSF